MATQQILTAAGAGTGSAVTLPLRQNSNWPLSAEFPVGVGGNPDGADVELEYSPDGGTTWILAHDFGTMAANVSARAAVLLPYGARVRGKVTGGIAPAVDMFVG